jgi:hypothetical protein
MPAIILLPVGKQIQSEPGKHPFRRYPPAFPLFYLRKHLTHYKELRDNTALELTSL